MVLGELKSGSDRENDCGAGLTLGWETERIEVRKLPKALNETACVGNVAVERKQKHCSKFAEKTINREWNFSSHVAREH